MYIHWQLVKVLFFYILWKFLNIFADYELDCVVAILSVCVSVQLIVGNK